MEQIKACPFCGGKAIIDDCGDHRYFARCQKCGINQDHLYSQKCDAIKAWNRRASEIGAKRGEWIGAEYDGYADGNPVYDSWTCSVCHTEIESEGEPPWFRYCPNCGARMEGEV